MAHTNQTQATEQDDPFCEVTVLPMATQRHINEAFDLMTGGDVVISGVKKDKTRFTDRILENVSFDRTAKGGVVIKGYSPDSKGVRSFNVFEQLSKLVAK